MTKLLLIAFSAVCFLCTDTEKLNYLKKNCFDLNNENFQIPEIDFKIIGFGAYHGSKKTEDVEIALVNSLTQQKQIKYYLPETDFSLAYFFNQFLLNGDTLLLQDLVKTYGIRVSQERTIEVYNKWKKLKQINDALDERDKITVVGIDYQVNYKYVSKHL